MYGVSGPEGRRSSAATLDTCVSTTARITPPRIASRRAVTALNPTLRGSEADDAVARVLLRLPVADEDIDVAQDLGEGQVGLGDRRVSPHHPGDLVGGERAVANHLEHLRGPPLVHGEALVDQRAVVEDRVPVPRQGDSG